MTHLKTCEANSRQCERCCDCLLMHRMPSFVTAALLSGALWSTFAASDSVVDGSGRPDLRLLFVGNSLLYYNGGVYKVVAGLLHEQFSSAIIQADEIVASTVLGLKNKLVVASLLHNHFPNATIQADQVVGSNFLFSQHLQQAQIPGTSQYETLSSESKDHWDFVLFQEESQQVALGGDANSKSLDALTQLAKLAAARGARVGVDLTWAWLNGKNPKFPDFNNMQGKVNAGYAADMKELIASDGNFAFIAPSGLGWQVVDDLVNAAKSGTSAASAQEMSPITQICKQSAAVEGTVSPAQGPGAAVKTASQSGAPQAAPRAATPSASITAPASAPTAQPGPTRAAQQLPVQVAPAPAVRLPYTVASVQFVDPSAEAQASGGMPQAEAPAPAAGAEHGESAKQLPALAAPAPAVRLPATVASIQFTAGRRLRSAKLSSTAGIRAGAAWQPPLSREGEPMLAAGSAARRLLQPQPVQAAAFIDTDSAIGAPAPSPASVLTKVSAPMAATAATPASAFAPAPGPSQGNEAALAIGPAPSEAGAPESAAGALVEEAPAPEHETVIIHGSATAVPAPTQGAAVEGSTGGLCSPSVLPAGTDTFAQLYASDGNHPSDPGTYLQGLIIASSITGCRMKGNGFTFGLDSRWYTFLQDLSDAVVFEATPAQFPPYPWSSTGPRCMLKP